ncbi:MAG: Crp/Fnr family transcriptional regulator [Acidobacteria bacterium]|nr:Crp/Fnr family transcriptional regulator [Acidobacteriota bacterium]MCA1638957.1 Crp/Fnr family transcriptional regulator [Acidobacteriota bacterium]
MHDTSQEPIKTSQDSINNTILKNLPTADFKRLFSKLQKIDLPVFKYCYHSEQPITHVYFPEYAVASVVSSTSDGHNIEIGIIGNEGMVGVDVLLGVDSSPNACFIQIPNGGYRMTTQAIREEFEQGGELQKSLLRYTHALMTQISQTALCNRLHLIEQRLARWLLMCHDRTKGDVIDLTQEFLSLMLGVNRPTVTVAASILQGAGFIKYSRGKIIMLDREELEDFTCECYKIVKPEYDRIAQ